MTRTHSALRLLSAPPLAPDTSAVASVLLERMDSIADLLFFALEGLDCIEAAAPSAHVQDHASAASGALDAALRELRDVSTILSAEQVG
jgi:hypothetical protein